VHEDIWSESLIVKLVDAWLRSVATAIFGGEPLTSPKEQTNLSPQTRWTWLVFNDFQSQWDAYLVYLIAY